MTAGLEVASDKGTIQITDKQISLSLESRHDVQPGRPLNVSGKVMAIKPDKNNYIHAPMRTDTDYELKGQGRVYVFDTNPRPTKQGLEIYESNGAIAFSSNNRLLKVIDSGYFDVGGAPFRKKYDKPVAVVFNSVSVAIYPISQVVGGYNNSVEIPKVSIDRDGYLVVDMFEYYFIRTSSPEVTVYNKRSHFLVVDATNLDYSIL